MIALDFSFETEMWLYQGGKASWHLITVPKDEADQIKFFKPFRAGFGSVKVKVRIGMSSWKTSIFPDKDSGSFIMPIKKQIREQENIKAGDRVTVHMLID